MNEVVIETKFGQSCCDKVPFQHVKCLSQIYFEKESMGMPTFQIKRVDDFLGYDYIKGNMFVDYEG